MKPGGSMLHSQGSQKIRILSRIIPIPRIDMFLQDSFNILILSSHRLLSLHEGLFPIYLTNPMTYGTQTINAEFTMPLQ